MAKSRKRNTAKRVRRPTRPPHRAGLFGLSARFVWGSLVSTGLLLVLITAAYRFVYSEVTIRYVEHGPNRGYIFELQNTTPVDIKIGALRVKVAQSIGRVTKPMTVLIDPRTREILQSEIGPVTHPAEQFRGADGLVIPAGESIRFRLPSIQRSSLLEETRGTFQIAYDWSPNRKTWSAVYRAGLAFHVIKNSRTSSFLLDRGFISPIPDGKLEEDICTHCSEPDD